MICHLIPSLEAHRGAARFNDPGQQVLGLSYGDLRESPEAVERLGLIQRTLGNLRINGRATLDIDSGESLHGFPESIIVETVEPLFEFVLIIKHQHDASVPKPPHALQTCARNARSRWPAGGSNP